MGRDLIKTDHFIHSSLYCICLSTSKPRFSYVTDLLYCNSKLNSCWTMSLCHLIFFKSVVLSAAAATSIAFISASYSHFQRRYYWFSSNLNIKHMRFPLKFSSAGELKCSYGLFIIRLTEIYLSNRKIFANVQARSII